MNAILYKMFEIHRKIKTKIEKQTGLLLSCAEEDFESTSSLIEAHLNEPMKEKTLLNHKIESTTTFKNNLKKTTDSIRLNDSVSNLNLSLSLSIQNIQPVKSSDVHKVPIFKISQIDNNSLAKSNGKARNDNSNSNINSLTKKINVIFFLKNIGRPRK